MPLASLGAGPAAAGCALHSGRASAPSRAQWAAAVLKSPNPRLSPPRPSVDTRIFAKAGDARDTSGYPPASRVADAMRWMLDCPPDVCVPELLLEQHRYEC